MRNEEGALLPLDRLHLIEFTNLSLIVFVTLLSSLRFFFLDTHDIPWPALVVVSGAIANAIYIRRNGSALIAAWVLISLSLFGLIYGSIRTGAFSGPVVLLAPLIPIYTMLLINARNAWAALGFVCFTLAGLLFFEFKGAIPENPNSPDQILFGRFITLLALCLMSTLIVWSFTRMSDFLLSQIERQSNTDHLTGILNRRGIEAVLSLEVGRVKRTNEWLSFVMADVDRFKLYNDTNGHQAGDKCLIKVARVISSSSKRSTDAVGRFGGEEFMVVLPDVNAEGAYQVAENIRNEILKLNIPYGPDHSEPVSLTMGVVSARGHSIKNSEQLIRLADDALYQGKHKGRNCVVSVVLADNEATDPQLS